MQIQWNVMLFTCLIQASDRYLTLQEAASGMHPPIKTSLKAILTQFFDITLIGGQK